MPTIEEQKAAVIAMLEEDITRNPPASTLAIWQLYTAIAGGSFGGGTGDASEATLQAILAKLPDPSAPNTSTGATHTNTAGTVPAGAKLVYFSCLAGTATLFGGGITLDATGETGVPDFNLEYPGPGGHGAIAWDASDGTIIIAETR